MHIVGREPDPSLERLLDYLRRARGFVFTTYKRTTLSRRVQRRMQIVGVHSYEEYTDYLEVHADEFALLFDAVLINVTRFFRDPDVWRHLREAVIPQIIEEGAGDTAEIRVWSAGCSSGEEVYSVAILLAEALGDERFQQRVKIYGTDLDDEALAIARQGAYSAKAVADIPDDLRERYFERAGTRFAFRSGLRRSLIFGRHDVTIDAPISRLDLLLCRNLLMYLNAETQEAVLSRFYFAVRDEGFLCLGRAEMLLSGSHFFAPADLRSRLFTKSRDVSNGSLAHARPLPLGSVVTVSAGRQLRDLAFEASPVAQLVVNFEGFLVAANDEAKSQFSIHATDIPRPLQDIDLSFHPLDVRARLEQTYAERRVIVVRNVERRFADGHTQYMDVTFTPVPSTRGGEKPHGIVIAFADVTRYNVLQLELKRSSEELSTAYEELQSANEELETTNEELQAANEELETTNEELQATNEELETTNEELQATNEELETINDELRVRGEEFDTTARFLESILGSEHAALIVLDGGLRVQSWNRAAEALWGFGAGSVSGRRFFDLDTGITPAEDLGAAIRVCTTGLSRIEELTMQAIDSEGRHIAIRVVCTPLVGPVRGGVVLLMEEMPVAYAPDEQPAEAGAPSS